MFAFLNGLNGSFAFTEVLRYIYRTYAYGYTVWMRPFVDTDLFFSPLSAGSQVWSHVLLGGVSAGFKLNFTACFVYIGVPTYF